VPAQERLLWLGRLAVSQELLTGHPLQLLPCPL
jgi:hypothetical protein